MRQCTHARKGIVTTHPQGYPYPSPDDVDRAAEREAHASRACCDRPACIEAAIRWAAAEANRTAFWSPDPQPRRVAS